MRAIVILALIPLSGCALFQPKRQVFEPSHQAKVSEKLLGECDKVVDIPDRDLSQKEEHDLWAKDRRSLGECGYAKHVLNKAVRIQQEQPK